MKSCCYFLCLSSDLITFGTEHVHRNLFSDCGFCENRHSENHASLKGVVECLPVLSTCIVKFGRKSM
jgi:hypothetical protein